LNREHRKEILNLVDTMVKVMEVVVRPKSTHSLNLADKRIIMCPWEVVLVTVNRASISSKAKRVLALQTNENMNATHTPQTETLVVLPSTRITVTTLNNYNPKLVALSTVKVDTETASGRCQEPTWPTLTSPVMAIVLLVLLA
jgi:hypothetical protein